MKKSPQIPVILTLLGSLSLAGCDLFDFFSQHKSSSSEAASSSASSSVSSSVSSSASSSSSSNAILSSGERNYAPISFHFIEQGIQNTGDLIYIKAGENDILIDGGARPAVAGTAKKYIDQYVTDGRFEYVFATHGHQDHLAGLYGKSNKSLPGGRDGLLYSYKVGTIVDFSFYGDNKITIDNSSSHELTDAESKATTTVYKNYRAARAYAIEQGATHYTAKELTTSEKKWKVELGEGLSVTLLYQFYYDHTRADTKALDPSYSLSNFSDQNDYSIGLLFEQGERQFLFTGDMEEYAEASLVKSNPELHQVSLFKAGHHGSPTASTQTLLNKIQPQAVVACCCAGNTEYGQKVKDTTFPGQAVIDRAAPYTDRFYVTTQGSFEDKSFHEPLNGNIVFNYDPSGSETVTCSASQSVLKDTEWFKENRTMPAAWKEEK